MLINKCIHYINIMKKIPFQVYLDPRDQGLLEQAASLLGVSKAEAVREALRRLARELSGTEDPLLKLIGGLDNPGVPSDLSLRYHEYAARRHVARRVAEPEAEEDLI